MSETKTICLFGEAKEYERIYTDKETGWEGCRKGDPSKDAVAIIKGIVYMKGPGGYDPIIASGLSIKDVLEYGGAFYEPSPLPTVEAEEHHV